VILVWEGWGLVAMVAAFLPLASCVGLMDWDPIIAELCAGVSAVASGVVCRRLGLKWNQGRRLHTMYMIPLETWGWIYIVGGSSFVLLFGVGFVKKFIFG
jgi:hypothetical protein